MGIAGRKGLDLGLVHCPLQMIPNRAGWRSAFAGIAGFDGVLLTFLHAVNLALTVSGRVPVTTDLGYGAPSIPYARSTWSRASTRRSSTMA